MTFWPAIHKIDALSAVPATWRRHLEGLAVAFAAAFLDPCDHVVTSYPCPRGCNCSHTVVQDSCDAFRAYCLCEARSCPTLHLTRAEVTPHKVNLPKLLLATATSLEIDHHLQTLEHPATFEIGSWSPHGIPAIFTIQRGSDDLTAVAAQLAAKLRREFILLSPIATPPTSPILQVLAPVRARHFALDAITTTPGGNTILPVRPPSALFDQLLPGSVRQIVLRDTPAPPKPRYALCKGQAVWTLTFDGNEATLRDAVALHYIAYLLEHPNEDPIHPRNLIGKIPALARAQTGIIQIEDPVTGEKADLEAGTALQQPSLKSLDQERIRSLLRKKAKLEAILDSTETNEPEKREAELEIDQIDSFIAQNKHRSRDDATRASDTVRKAIRRLLDSLEEPTSGTQNLRTTRRFAEHIASFIIAPSRPQLTHGGLVYTPPPQFRWHISR